MTFLQIHSRSNIKSNQIKSTQITNRRNSDKSLSTKQQQFSSDKFYDIKNDRILFRKINRRKCVKIEKITQNLLQLLEKLIIIEKLSIISLKITVINIKITIIYFALLLF